MLKSNAHHTCDRDKITDKVDRLPCLGRCIGAEPAEDMFLRITIEPVSRSPVESDSDAHLRCIA
jgi:hypothetical protein